MAAGPRACRVIIGQGSGSETKVIRKDIFVIGRVDTCDIAIPSHGVSRQHLRVNVREDEIFIADLGSANGTMINGKKMEPRVEYGVRPSDIIEIGNLGKPIRFEVDNEEQDKTAPRFQPKKHLLKDDIHEKPVHIPGQKLPNSMPEVQLADPEDEFRQARKRGEDDAARLLKQAQSEAEDMMASAKDLAQRTQAEAKANAQKLMKETHAAAEKIRQSASLHADMQLKEAREKELSLVSNAEQMAQSLIDEAEKQASLLFQEGKDEALEYVDKAKTQAAITISEGREKSIEILQQAKRQSNEVRKAADSEAYAIVEKARSQVMHIRERAEAEGQIILQDAQDRGLKILEQYQSDAADVLKQARSEVVQLKQSVEKENQESLQKARAQATQIRAEAKTEFEGVLDRANARSQEVYQGAIVAAQQELELQRHKMIESLERDRQKVLEDATEEGKIIREKAKASVASSLAERQHIEQEIAAIRQRNASVFKENETLDQQREALTSQILEARTQLQGLMDECKNEQLRLEEELKSHETRLTEFAARKAEAEKKILEANEEFGKVQAARKAEAQEIENLTLLRAQMGRENHILKGRSESEHQELRAKLGQELKELRIKSDLDQQERIKRQEQEMAELRLKAIEDLKSLRTDEERSIKAKRQHQIQEISRHLEMVFIPRIREGLKGKDVPESLFNLSSEIKETVRRVVEEDSSVVKSELDRVISFDEDKQRLLRMKRIKTGAAIATPILLLIIWVFFPGVVKTAKTRLIASLEDGPRAPQAARERYAPERSTNYKKTYTENLLFTLHYQEFRSDPDAQTNLVRALNTFMVEELGLKENLIITYSGLETSLVSELIELRESIDPKFVDIGIGKMDKAEAEGAKKLRSLFSDDKKFDKVRDFEKAFFKKHYGDIR